MHLEGSCHCRRIAFSCEAYAPVPYQRCHCSICRKTAGGGGYAINLGAWKKSLKVKGREHLAVYRARIEEDGKIRVSRGQRNFCRHCASALWMYDPSWPTLVHPFASAIDTPLPPPPERVHINLEFKAPWVQVRRGKHDPHYAQYSDESLEDWHRRHGLLDGKA
jgi:hypothetical protein